MDLIVTTKEELSALIEAAVKKVCLPHQGNDEEKFPRLLNKESGSEFLKFKGFEITPRTLWSYTHSMGIPYQKFGVRVMYDRDQLLQWATDRLSTKRVNREAAQALAASARKKSATTYK